MSIRPVEPFCILAPQSFIVFFLSFSELWSLRRSTAAVDAFRIKARSGNLESGTVRVYGVSGL